VICYGLATRDRVHLDDDAIDTTGICHTDHTSDGRDHYIQSYTRRLR